MYKQSKPDFISIKRQITHKHDTQTRSYAPAQVHHSTSVATISRNRYVHQWDCARHSTTVMIQLIQFTKVCVHVACQGQTARIRLLSAKK